jgi:hypothetical protein
VSVAVNLWVDGLEAALGELGRLGLRGVAFMRDDAGKPGLIVVSRGAHAGDTRTFTTERTLLASEEQALAWAAIVATLALEVRA